jgi:hypothetical protein
MIFDSCLVAQKVHEKKRKETNLFDFCIHSG